MFSFGPLKTSTALAGALAWVRDEELAGRMREILQSDPAGSNLGFARRLLKLGLLRLFLQPVPYGALAAWSERGGTPFIETSRGWLHSFPGRFNVAPLQHRPSPALLRLLARRLAAHEGGNVRARQRSGELSLSQMPKVQVPGRAAQQQSWWIFPVLVADPPATMEQLRSAGFEAVPGLSNLVCVDPPPGRGDLEPAVARHIVRHSILIPVRPGLSPEARRRLSDLVNQAALSKEPALTKE
jgi:dTDP-4-amino-4,6-dideoxygalactose transaminase